MIGFQSQFFLKKCQVMTPLGSCFPSSHSAPSCLPCPQIRSNSPFDPLIPRYKNVGKFHEKMPSDGTVGMFPTDFESKRSNYSIAVRFSIRNLVCTNTVRFPIRIIVQKLVDQILFITGPEVDFHTRVRGLTLHKHVYSFIHQVLTL